MTENNSITKSRLINALHSRIVKDFIDGFNEGLNRLLNSPDELSQSSNRVFVRNVRGIKLTDDLLEEIRNVLLNEFGFTSDDVYNIGMSSDDSPCLMVEFSLED